MSTILSYLIAKHFQENVGHNGCKLYTQRFENVMNFIPTIIYQFLLKLFMLTSLRKFVDNVEVLTNFKIADLVGGRLGGENKVTEGLPIRGLELIM